MELEKQKELEETFKSMLLQLGITNFESKTALKYQSFFFNGINVALNTVPPLWGVCLMLGRSIINEREKER